MIVFELDAWPEPKALGRNDIQALMKRFKTTVTVAQVIGVSQSFVSFKLVGNKKWCRQRRKFIET